MPKRVIFSIGPEALQREGLRATPEVWEDGLRAEPKAGNFEWWYFDSQLEDGSTAVVVFFTKTLLDRQSRLKPGVSLTITRPTGEKLSATSQVLPADFSASKERCYVRAGESWVRGDLCTYELHAKAGDLVAQLNFTGLVPPWRPGAGKNYYNEEMTRYFAWFPAIPHGTVEGHLIYDGKVHPVKGACYHDHNWGNVGLNEVLSHWYWGRAHLGDYTLIFAEMNATERYSSQKIPVFMLAKDSQILSGDGGQLSVEELDFIADPGGRSYPEGLNLEWKNETMRVSLKLREPRLIDSFSLLDLLPTWQRLIGKIIANPYYFRFKADLDLQIDSGDPRSVQPNKQHTRMEGQALYELIWLR
jgi:predicted secreted hydrolase